MTVTEHEEVVDPSPALRPAFPLYAGPRDGGAFEHAMWVGEVDVATPGVRHAITLDGGLRYERARLLVRHGHTVCGLVEVPVVHGVVGHEVLWEAIASLDLTPRPVDLTGTQGPELPISVIVCTRDRPADLRRCLAALLEAHHADVDIVVVDSASTSAETREVVDGLAGRGVRYVRVARPGLSRARNAGVLAARHEHLAFTDDDVLVDAHWLDAVAAGFRTTDVACVTGLVATGQIESVSQAHFDQRVTWARNTVPRTFRVDAPPADVPLFPFQFGVYGTGANFAVRRSDLDALGGFDEALGVGSPCGGGEDIDLFVRVVLSGRSLRYEPDALVWHKHRLDDTDLTAQLTDYGVGLGAVLTKLAGDRSARRAMVPLLLRGVRHARSMVEVDDAGSPQRTRDAARAELKGIAKGPWTYLRARRRPDRSGPVGAPTAHVGARESFRADVRRVVDDEASLPPMWWLLDPTIWALGVFRIGQWIGSWPAAPRRVAEPLHSVLALAAVCVTGIELNRGAQIGPGCRIWHGRGLVVHPSAVIGRDVSLRQGVTVGSVSNTGPSARLGDRVDVGAYAQILGDITVGDGASIGAGAVVVHEVPSGRTAVGVPAKLVLIR